MLDHAYAPYEGPSNSSAWEPYPADDSVFDTLGSGSSTLLTSPRDNMLDGAPPACDANHAPATRSSRARSLYNTSQAYVESLDDEELDEMLLQAFERIVPSPRLMLENGDRSAATPLGESSDSSRPCPYAHLISFATPDAVTPRPRLLSAPF